MRRLEWPPSRPRSSSRAVGRLALVELHAEVDQLADARRPFASRCAHDLLVAEPGAGVERVAHVQVEGVLAARHAQAMPPCAQAVFESGRARLVTIATDPCARP